MKYLLYASIFIFLFSCNEKPPIKYNSKSKPEKEVRIEELTEDIDIEEVKLASNYQQLALSNARNIGEFFDHRIKFFKIDAPAMSIGPSEVDEVVLYFVDSTLARIRYRLKEDVSNYLMDSLGVSRFKPLDERSKELLASKTVWNKYKRKLHEDLRNYELVWRKLSSVTRFRVNRDEKDSITSFLYYHEMPGYKAKVREIETLYNLMDKTSPIPELN